MSELEERDYYIFIDNKNLMVVGKNSSATLKAHPAESSRSDQASCRCIPFEKQFVKLWRKFALFSASPYSFLLAVT